MLGLMRVCIDQFVLLKERDPCLRLRIETRCPSENQLLLRLGLGKFLSGNKCLKEIA